MNSPSLAELKLKFLREELSRCFALITEAERRFDPSNADEVKRSLGHVEVAHSSLSNFLRDSERMKHLNDEQQRELRESAEDLGRILERSRRSLLERKEPQRSAEIAVL